MVTLNKKIKMEACHFCALWLVVDQQTHSGERQKSDPIPLDLEW